MKERPLPLAVLEGPGGRAFALVWTEKGVLAVERTERGDFARDPSPETVAEIDGVLERLRREWGPDAVVEVAGEEIVQHAVVGAFEGGDRSFALLAAPGVGVLLVRVEERGPILVVEEAVVERFRSGLARGSLVSARSVADALLETTAVRRRRPVEWLSTDPVRVVVQEAFVGEERFVRATTGPRSDPGAWFARANEGGWEPVDAARAPHELAPALAIGQFVKVEVRGAARLFAIEALVPLGGVVYSIAVPVEGDERGWVALARVDGALSAVRDESLALKIDRVLGEAAFLDRERGPIGRVGPDAKTT